MNQPENVLSDLPKLYGAALLVAMVGLAIGLFVPVVAYVGVVALLLVPIVSALRVLQSTKNDVVLTRSIIVALACVGLAVLIGFFIRK